MSGRRKLVIGNWKMNGTRASGTEIDAIASGLAVRAEQQGRGDGVQAAICPPATLIATLSARLAAQPGPDVLALGGQTCHPNASGAHTGDISSDMLRDAGAAWVIVGHSERRADHKETDAQIRAQAEAALRAGLSPIICVGETEAERDAGRALEVVGAQLAGSTPDEAVAATTVIAYEPVWAIGTGRTPTEDEIATMHGSIRDRLRQRFGDEADKLRLLYGGSVKPANAEAIFSLTDVDGGLIGGASLKATDFLAIVDAAAKAE
ncbi:MAG: triose-phosphate isomerase [Rhodobacteraceae bacterium]|nr:triose-phosphate isomerase [Paracoccaceae bacterium]